MKFYLCYDKEGEVIDCFMTLKEAKEEVIKQGSGYVWMIDVDVTAESMRRVLTGRGYAKEQRLSFRQTQEA